MLEETAKYLVSKAYDLNFKLQMTDQVREIQDEEKKLAELLRIEEDNHNNINS